MIAGLGGPVALEVVRVVVLLGVGLLVLAGIAKLRRPATAAEALGWRTSTRTAGLFRGVGLGELALAALVVVVGGPLALLGLAGAYVAFALVAARQRSRGASCACFGAAEAPTGWAHVGLNLAVAACAALAATTAAFAAAAQPLEAGVSGPLTLVFATLLVVAVVGVQQLLTALPDLRAATRRVTLPAPRTIEPRLTGAKQ